LHPGEVRIPITRILGGNRHDVSFEACIANYYHRHEIVEWLLYCLALPDNENILQNALYQLLISVEMIAQLRIGAIFFISIIVPMRWLAGNTHILAHREWGEKHMARSIDLVYDAMLKIQKNSKLFLKEDFMMNILKPLYSQLPELEDYLTWYFEEKSNYVAGTKATDVRKKGMKLVREELFYPQRIENRETHECCVMLSLEVANCLIIEFQDTSKVTHMYVNKLDGKLSMKKTSAEDKRDGYGIRANNDPSEQNFAVFDDALSTMGRGALSRAAGQGQSRYNGDFTRDISSMVTGRKSKADEEALQLGVFHKLPEELQNSLIATAKSTQKITHRRHIEDMARQRAYRAQKRKDLQEKQIKSAENKFKEASWLYQQYHSPRCWKTSKIAFIEFNKLSSNARKLKYTKEQILIRYLGLGWVKAHHPWSKNDHCYSAVELLDHLVKIVIPLQKTETVPSEAPIHLPRVPDTLTLGTKSSGVELYYKKQEESSNELKLKALREREQEELMGVYDQSEYMNEVNWPGTKLKKGYKIEKLFVYQEEGEEKLIWCPGIVLKVNKKDEVQIKADIKWDTAFIGQGEADESEEILKKNAWNPEKPKKGSWRQDVRDRMRKID
jgi:hypothetical protein